MIPVKRYPERQVENGIVRTEIIGPKETLLAELYGCREETEHGEEYRELQQHRKTSSHRVDTGSLVQVHHRLGFLHGIRYGRKSLALDMMEEFRQPVADRLVMLLFNKRIIGKYDFDFPENGSALLNEDGFRKFCIEYEKWMDGRNTASGEKSFRHIIRRQASKLKKAIMQKEDYVPYRWKEKENVHRQL